MTESQVQDIIRAMLFNQQGFAWRDLLGQDRWESRDQSVIGFTTQFSVTVVGTPTYKLRYRTVGKVCEFQCDFVATTSIATTAGTHYMSLPITANAASGGGCATMVNKSTNVAVGVGVIDVTNSRVYLPTQAAIGSTFNVSGWYEVN